MSFHRQALEVSCRNVFRRRRALVTAIEDVEDELAEQVFTSTAEVRAPIEG